MKCIRCKNTFDQERREKQCPYCRVANGVFPSGVDTGVEEMALEAAKEYRQEAIDMASGGWIE